MKITITGILLCCLCALTSLAQTTYSIKGAVTDTASRSKLVNTSVVILNAKDSTLRAYTRASSTGNFAVNNLTKGKYILLLTYPDFADYIEEFTLDSIKKEHNFGTINMTLKSRLLADVIIKGEKAAIKIKGDTTEYNASSYKLQPNAKVEDLLKQLEGITVDKDGKITAQGQTVNKVLVDGEEFFGDDPTLVTKNIRQDMVDKVQVYDKKSDQATFTGIDDGEKTKTINIKLKEDKKNGYFGKVDAGAGTDDYYQAQVLFNKFKAKQKFSAYGTIGNTGKTGLGWEDNSKYGGSSSNMEFTDDGGIMIFGGGGDDLDSFDGRYSGEGKPVARTGGLHYDTKWNDDKESLNTNYKIGYLGVKGTKNIQTQNNLPETEGSLTTGIINSNSDQMFDNSMFRQKLDAIYQIKLDSTSNLKITIDGTIKNNKTQTGYLATSRREDSTMINRQERSLTNDGDQQMFNATAFYTKKLKKPGRTISVNLKQSLNENKSKGNLLSETDFYDDNGNPTTKEYVDQYKINDLSSSVFNSNFTYSEPLSKTFSVILNYGLNVNNSSADRKSFSPIAGQYTQFVDSVSSNYSLNQLSNQGGAVFNYKKGKSILNFGTKVSGVNFKQVDEYTGYKYKRNFTNWNPQASYQYKFSQQASIRLNYFGNTSQPSIDQIQPVRINNDPLNITLGNPDLEPSFRNTISASYNSYKVLSGQSIYLSGSYSFTNNAIVNNTVTNRGTGKSIFQYQNLGSETPSNYNAYVYLGRKIKKGDFNIGLNANINGSKSFSYINNALNTTKSGTYSSQLNISKYKQKKYEVYLSAGPSYTTGESSLQSQVNNNGRGFLGNGSLNIYLPGKVQISSELSYEFRGKTQSFNENFNRTLLNASLSKAFFKQENVKLVLSGNDLLDQNKGFSRSAYGSQITQTTYTTIRRYFLLSFVWDFNKMGGVLTPSK
jgi:hypothetical protein